MGRYGREMEGRGGARSTFYSATPPRLSRFFFSKTDDSFCVPFLHPSALSTLHDSPSLYHHPSTLLPLPLAPPSFDDPSSFGITNVLDGSGT